MTTECGPTPMEVDSVSASKPTSASSPKRSLENMGTEQSRNGGNLPQIVVKKEPTSPEPPPTARHRPPRLLLKQGNNNVSTGGTTPRTAALTSDKNLMHEVGMACLSPGFSTHDPAMREQLQRSISVRDQQRSIIESRLNKGVSGEEGREDPPHSARGDRTSSGDRPMGSARKKPPPHGLTIVPPPARQFANERVIQSAPLNQSFTGRNIPLHHHNQYNPSQLNQSSQLPPPQTSNQINRLPPITDVFGPEKLDGNRSSRTTEANRPYLPPSRPSYPSPNSLVNNRPREYASAEEAVQQMAGGREELLPRIVHYGGHQPPTPPSPPMQSAHIHASHHSQHPTKMAPINGSMSSNHHPSARRRGREEYERDGSYGSDNDTNTTQHPDTKRRKDETRRKKEEFMELMSRAWDLLHS